MKSLDHFKSKENIHKKRSWAIPRFRLLKSAIFTFFALRERLRTHKVFTKDQSFYLNYHKFSIKSYVVDVY